MVERHAFLDLENFGKSKKKRTCKIYKNHKEDAYIAILKEIMIKNKLKYKIYVKIYVIT